ncbi:sensor histidine kinase [Bacillus sp. S/N-304-OC-R1]|uniref:ATP-binding protein n=1 Tax=Bacillus sp. S/N-304-OC-R1 TaxID=2758034 RepID=UPI001C8EB7DE|nr:sensor histidine kinase [Bacillus sp. S/N-304-OC-R1]MBY0121441.1 GHKL domain-containing protein [Bacillus sp. S/N-304-OC-R1]
MLETFLINILILLLPVLFFLLFFEKRFITYYKAILIILSMISMLLCMKYPIVLEIGYNVDLRYIPFIIFALFSGYKYTSILYIVLNLYRFYIGGHGSLQSLAFSTIIFIVVPLFNKWFLKQSPKKRILCAVSAAVMTMIFYLITLIAFLPALNDEYWTMAYHTILTHAFVMFIIMILIEQIIANRQERELLFQSEKFEVMSDLAASVAHEIRNPLTVTNGFLQLLQESKSISQEDKRYIDISLNELKRAEGIVSEFLAFSRPQSQNMVTSNLKNEIEYARNILIPYANMHQVNIELDYHNKKKVTYDNNQVQQCLINLYKNAIEAMKDTGGTLAIDVTEKKKAIEIQIKDTGIGMTEEEISQLGRPYYSTKKEGTGLGMLMVYSTISKLNGKIHVDSEKGKGTTFLITVPAGK